MIRRIISMVLVLTMSLMILPLDAQAVVNEEVKGFVEGLSSAASTLDESDSPLGTVQNDNSDNSSEQDDDVPNDDSVSSSEQDDVPNDDSVSSAEPAEDMPWPDEPIIPDDDEMPAPEDPVFPDDDEMPAPEDPSEWDILPEYYGDDYGITAEKGDIVNYTVADDGAYITFQKSKGTVTRFYSATGEGAFEQYDIVIPSTIEDVSVTSIGASAFGSCKQLESINIPDGVTAISNNTFSYCTSLKEIDIPDSVTKIGAYAFQSCTSLVCAKLPERLDSIENGTFHGCKMLSDLTMPISCPAINNNVGYNFGAFAGCSSLTSITLPADLTKIGKGTFSRSGLTSIVIPDSVAEISDYAFKECTSLKEIDIPDSVTKIGAYAFRNCTSLVRAKLPERLDSIENGTFYGCKMLSDLTMPISCPNISGGNTTDSGAFADCSSLTSITLPADLTKIGSKTFSKCQSLSSINLPETLKEIGYDAFYKCTGLSGTIVLPEGLEAMGALAFFGCNSIEAIQFPRTLKTINAQAFKSCTSLKEVVIPEGVTTISDSAFNSCTSLEYIKNSDGVNGFPRGVTVMARSVLEGCSNLKEFVIPDTVETLGEFAFANCSSLKEIIMPSSVKYMDGHGKNYTIGTEGSTFSGCKKLRKVVLSENLEEIAIMAFSGCSFTGIVLPESVQVVYGPAFNNSVTYAVIYNPDMKFEDSHGNPFNKNTVIYGYVGSTAEAYCEKYGMEFRDIRLFDSGRIVTVSLTTSTGAKLSNASFRWYDEKGKLLDGTSNVFLAEKGKKYSFELDLPSDNSSVIYKNPGRIIVGADETDISLVIEQYDLLTLTGKIVDSSGKTISGAAVSAAYAEGSVKGNANSSGFSLKSVPKTDIVVTVTKDGYYTSRKYFNLSSVAGEQYDIGTVVLSETVKDRIILNVFVNKAVSKDESAYVEALSSLKDFDVHVYRENGSEITGLEIQRTSIIFQPNAVSANQTLMVTINDATGKYIVSGDLTVTLDSEKMATANYTVTEKGSFIIESASTSNYVIMLFGSDGNLIFSDAANIGTSYGALEAGSYTVVIIEKNDLLSSVPALSYLDSAGLKAGTDYYRTDITIKDGVISKLSNVKIPTLDETKFSYTVPGSTSLSLYDTNSPAHGTMFMLRGEYTVDPASGLTPESIRIVLPEGIEATTIRVATVNGNQVPCTYNEAARTLTFECDESEATYYVYAVASEIGKHYISAYLSYQGGAVQPLGTVIANVNTAELATGARTGKKSFNVSGKAIPGADVIVYDNGEKVGEATANLVGSWSLNVTLAEPTYNFSYHFLNAEIRSDKIRRTIVTDDVMVVYNENDPTLEKITMYYGANSKDFDFTSESSKRTSYNVARNQEITFVAYFDQPTNVSDVYIVTESSKGEKIYVSTVYDEETGGWVGSRWYNDKTLPYEIYAIYQPNVDYSVTATDEFLDDIEAEFQKLQERIEYELDKIPEGTYTAKDFDADTMSSTLVYNDPETGISQDIGTVGIDISTIDSSVTAETLEQDGYFTVEQAGKEFWSRIGSDGKIIYLEYVYLEDMSSTLISIDISSQTQASDMRIPAADKASSRGLFGIDWGPEGGNTVKELLGALPYVGLVVTVYDNFTLMHELGDEKSEFLNMLRGNVAELKRELNTIYSALEETCPDGRRKLSDSEYNYLLAEANNLKEKIEKYEKDIYNQIQQRALERYLWFLASLAVVAAVGFWATPFLGFFAAWGTSFLATEVMKYTGMWLFDKKDFIDSINASRDNLHRQMKDLSEDIESSKRKCDDNDDQGPIIVFRGYESDKKGVKPVHDPSGYIYEAVPSNRVEGVTAVISSEADGVWNAEDYDQINPQITGSDGAYEWFVPEGNWKVNFTKDGYEDADTSLVPQAVNGWLPVPPPQMNINVGIISKASPVIENAVAYTNGVEIEFSQYMDIKSVKSAISLTSGGSSVRMTVEPMDAEYNADGTVQYATRFKVVPSSGSLKEKVTVRVASSAKNYVGKTIGTDYISDEMTPLQRPEKINISSRIPVLFHGKVTATVILEPSISGKTLNIENLSPGLVGISAEHITTGADGSATFVIEGKLLGSGIIRITEPESGLTKDITVEISFEASPEPVTATLEDGTPLKSGMTLNKGDKIYLSTSTDGAVIRYTLDDTCPCEDAALTFSGPIEYKTGINVIRAAAYKDGKYSSTIRIELASEFIFGDVDNDGKVTSRDRVTFARYLAAWPGYEDINEAAADVDNDGKVTSRDRVTLARHLAGWPGYEKLPYDGK